MLSIIIFIASLALARVTVSCGSRAGLVDHPGARKQHAGAVPLTGGIAIFLTILFGTLLLSTPPLQLADDDHCLRCVFGRPVRRRSAH